MGRTWSTGSLTTSLGGLGITSGGITIAAIHRRANDTDASAGIVRGGAGATSTARWWLGTGPSTPTKLAMRSANSTSEASSLTFTVADGWCLVACSKATGTVAPRLHKYVFATGVWTHDNGATAMADSAVITTGAVFGAALGDYDTGAVWNRVLSDDEVERLAGSLIAWYSSSPVALWRFDQASTTQKLYDLSGGGANESALSGSTVSDGAAGFSYGADPVRPTAAAGVAFAAGTAAATATGGTVAISAGATINADAGSVSAGGEPLAISAGATIAPGSATATAAGDTVAISAAATIGAGAASATAAGDPATPSGVGLALTVVAGTATAAAAGATVAISAGNTFTAGTSTAAADGEPVTLSVVVPTRGLRFQFTGLWKPGDTSVPFYGTVADPQAGEVVIPLNDSRTASVTVSTRDPVIEVLEVLPQQTHAVFLKVFYEGSLVFWGPVKIRSPDLGAGTIRFDAVDMTLRLINHMLRRGDVLADGALAQANQDKGYVPVSQAGLMMLVAAAETETFPTLGIVAGTDTFGTAVHLIGFERGNPIYTAWQQVADSLGPDWSLDPDDTTEQVYANLNTYTRQGVDISAVVQLHYGCGLMNLEAFSFSEGEQYVNLVHVLDRDNKREVPVANSTALARTGPYIQWGATDYDITGLSDTDADAVLSAYGHDVIKAYSVPLLTVSLALAADTPDGLHFGPDFGIGDTVSVAGRDGFVNVPEGAYRITRWTASLDGQDGAVRQALDVIPDRVAGDTIDSSNP